MLNRFISASIYIPMVLIIWSISSSWNEIPTFILALVVGLLLNIEIMMMIKDKRDIKYPFILMSISITISVILNYLYSVNIINISLLFQGSYVLFFIMFYFTLGRELSNSFDFNKNIEHFGFIFLNYVTLVILFPQFLILKTLISNSWAIILLFLFSWINDACGLWIGNLYGKKQLTMLPSKSKTIEGYAGSIFFTILVSIILFYLQGVLRFSFEWSILKWISFGFLLSLSSNFGDLTESLIKRWADKKDSSGLIPGIGGLFDAIDSQIYSIPVILVYFS